MKLTEKKLPKVSVTSPNSFSNKRMQISLRSKFSQKMAVDTGENSISMPCISEMDNK